MAWRLRLLAAFLVIPCSVSGATLGTIQSLLGGASDIVLDEPRGQLYLVNTNSNRIEVYSIAQRRYLNPIRVGVQPLAAAMSRDGRWLYVTAYSQGSLDVIDLGTQVLTRRVNLPSKPEGVAVGIDGRVVVTTIGATTNPQLNMLVFDPSAASGQELTIVPSTIQPPVTPVTPPLGRPALATRSALRASQDGRLIFGVNNLASTRVVFVYEVASRTILRARIVNFVSSVLSISPDSSRFMAGLYLFDTETLNVLAQQSAANAPFTITTTNQSNFNTIQNQGGSIFSPNGQTLYSAFNIAPVQNPPARQNSSQLLFNDPDNLLIQLGIQLPENLVGKMVITADGGTIYALSESGFLTIPVSQINQNPIAIPEATSVLLANDQCGVVASQRIATVKVRNATGRGRMTAIVQYIPQTAQGPQFPGGGAIGGGPGGGVIVILPPGFPGGGGNAGNVGGGGNVGGATATAQAASAPAVRIDNTQADGPQVQFTFNPTAARSLGTVVPHSMTVQSPEAINLPPVIKVFQNNRNTEARARVIPVAVSAADNEGLYDMLLDSQRQRIYITNSGLNRVEVFDLRTETFLPPVKVGQLPHSMAFGVDGVSLYVANSGGESISIVDLDRLVLTGRVKFPPLPFSTNIPLATPTVIASSQRGPQFIMSSGANASTLWKMTGDQALPRPFNQSVFGAVTTVPGPSQTMTSTPGGEYVLMLSGNGTAYVYDASVDDWVAGRQLFAQGNQTGLSPLNSFFGPVAAGPRGQYFVLNSLVTNVALTPVNSSGLGTGGVGPGLPVGTTTTRPVAAVSMLSNTTFARYTQPPTTNANAVLADTNTVEIVDANTGSVVRSSPALEQTLVRVTGTALQRVNGRTMVVNPAGTTAYVISTSGLSIVPLAPVTVTERPVVSPGGIVNLANGQPQIAIGGLFSILGRNLGSDASASPPLPTILGGLCVTVNNTPIPLIKASDGQVNAQFPPELAAGRYSLIVRSVDRQTSSPPVTFTVTKTAPAVFGDETGRALVFKSDDNSPVTKDNPAQRDQAYYILATGLGPTTGGKVVAGQPAPANPPAVTPKVQAYFGNPALQQSEMIVDWSGLSPGLVGVYQVRVRVPGFRSRGTDLPVTLRIGGLSSPLAGAPTVAVE